MIVVKLDDSKFFNKTNSGKYKLNSDVGDKYIAMYTRDCTLFTMIAAIEVKIPITDTDKNIDGQIFRKIPNVVIGREYFAHDVLIMPDTANKTVILVKHSDENYDKEAELQQVLNKFSSL